MGPFLSLCMAELVMGNIEKKAISSFDHQIDLYNRYVDDTFVVLQENLIHPFHVHLNSINENIQLTTEEEMII